MSDNFTEKENLRGLIFPTLQELASIQYSENFKERNKQAQNPLIKIEVFPEGKKDWV